jgi:hypothetical protein
MHSTFHAVNFVNDYWLTSNIITTTNTSIDNPTNNINIIYKDYKYVESSFKINYKNKKDNIFNKKKDNKYINNNNKKKDNKYINDNNKKDNSYIDKLEEYNIKDNSYINKLEEDNIKDNNKKDNSYINKLEEDNNLKIII